MYIRDFFNTRNNNKINSTFSTTNVHIHGPFSIEIFHQIHQAVGLIKKSYKKIIKKVYKIYTESNHCFTIGDTIISLKTEKI